MMFDPFCDQNQHKWHTCVRWRSRALIVRLPVGEERHWSEWLVHWGDGDEWEWHQREGQTWLLRLCCGFITSAQVDPREKKHIFSMCNFYYYFHSSCTYSSTVEMLKQNKTFTYFGNSAWWENLSWYFADNKATLSILTFLDTHPGNICSLSKKKKKITAWTHDLEMSVMSENKV